MLQCCVDQHIGCRFSQGNHSLSQINFNQVHPYTSPHIQKEAKHEEQFN